MTNQKHTLITYFNKSEIEETYQLLLEYAIRNYQKHKIAYQNLSQSNQENRANWNTLIDEKMTELKTQNININDKQIIDILEDRMILYKRNLEDNKAVIDLHFRIILMILVKNIPKDLTQTEIAEYIFDFVTQYITYSETYYKYCMSIPATNGIEFDFKDNVPVENSIKGTLVQGQGLCEDICDLIQYLGKAFNVNLNKKIVTYKNQLHSINTYEENGKISLIDATRVIKKDKNKYECFLVSADILNKNNDYFWKTNFNSTTIQKTNESKKYNMENIIKEVTESLPKIEYKPISNLIVK